MSFIGRYLLVGIIFVVIDSIWIAGIANKFYKSQLGSLLLAKPNLPPAVLFYLIYIWGIIYFVLDPGLAAHSFSLTLKHGLLLGLLMYATYDLTNLSTLKKWPAKVTVVDMLWGTFVTTAVSLIAYAILH